MGDAEQLNGPQSGKLASDPRQEQELPGDAGEVVSGKRPASVPPSQGMVRRSSLRPAPADYVPSVRDPSTLRPMMVVRAGDIEPQPHLPFASERAEYKTQPPPPSGADLQPAVAGAAQTAGENAPAIPAAPPVPIDLVPTSGRSACEPDASGEPARGTDGTAADSRAVDLPRATAFVESDRAVQQPAQSHATNVGTSVPASQRSRRGSVAFVSIGVAVLGAALVLWMQKPRVTQRAAESAVRANPTPQPAASSAAAVRELAVPEPNASSGESASAHEASARVEQPTAGTPEPASSPPQSATRVRLEVKPTDAKVHFRGREVPGPPYEFDVAKDQKIAVEVVRFGFVTAKVVIDDKKPVVSFGMIRARYKR